MSLRTLIRSLRVQPALRDQLRSNAVAPEESVSTDVRHMTAAVVQRAELEAAATNKTCAEVLEALFKERFESEGEAYLGIPFLRGDDVVSIKQLDELVSPLESSRHLACAYKDAETIVLVVANPFSLVDIMWASSKLAADPRALNHRLRWTSVAAMRALLSSQEQRINATQTLSSDAGLADDGAAEIVLSVETMQGAESDIVKLVNSVLFDALRTKASDVHFESQSTGLQVKYRIDGLLSPVLTRSGPDVASQCVSRVKVLARLDIAERRVPQDGRLRIRAAGRSVDVRVSVMPNVHGEDVVLRILDRNLGKSDDGIKLDRLGMPKAAADFVKRICAMPHGLFLVTGPTGSGKTTTLYAAMEEFNSGLEKFITIEDPVEYQLKGVVQIPVNEAKGLTFARGLRSILRHDPDRIMVGEIRDAETAEIAIQAALTGHLVLATVHANNALDVVGRLTSMGADRGNLYSALIGVMAQRLVRVNCPHCAEDYVPATNEIALASKSRLYVEDAKWIRSTGCSHCKGIGFLGRVAVCECLPFSVDLKRAIGQERAAFDVGSWFIANDLHTLHDSAVQLAVEGRTSLEEANRVAMVV